ncbi:TetR/AcrR family transcriptional regulator [Anaerovorax odorimutans]|uniref:TetR/AcrR family transcriptional regulator n=1 Tax=Anaerovorax odorimutans TaxID=109327 RepID=A0ABT1RTS4_9FIRM|nr:TetR/AcrR family transcriptional regulator [Anaerovorax odorimutans]MCQ4638608.1 TetR/AcrR family transcriptional regulator [Anaerovorax odorimutans]
MNKQPEITDATRENFIQAFCELYKKMPIKKITVKEIAERAGYSRVTFYSYFSNPYDVLNYMEDVFINHVTEGISKSLLTDRKLDDFLITFVNLANDNCAYGSILLLKPFSTQFINRLKESMVPILFDLFHFSAENKKAAYIFEFYLPGIISVFSKWFCDKENMPLEELAHLIEGILKDGVLSLLEEMVS